MTPWARTVVGLIALATFCGGTSAGKAQADVSAKVAALLETSWQKPTPSDFAAAQQQYDQLKSSAQGDVRIAYAIALVAAKNYRSTEAGQYLDEAPAGGSWVLPILKAKIWMAVLRNDDPATRSAIVELAKVLGKDESLVNRPEYQDAARWLGSVMGYFAGPGKGQLRAADMAALDAELEADLKGPLATALADGKKATAAKSEQLQKSLETAQAGAKERNESKLAEERKANSTALAKATTDLGRAQRQSKDFQEKYSDEIRSKDREISSAGRSLDDLKRLEDQLERRLNNERSQRQDRRNPQQISQLNSQLQNAKRKDRDLEGDIRRLKSRLNELSNQSSALAKEDKRLSALQQGLQRKAEQLSKPASSDDPLTVEMQYRLKSITTYAGIDLEGEKQRIIDSYRPR